MTATEGLRHQRDRFVAFAFAGADVLVEVDAGGIVRYAAGALARLDLGGADALVGRPFEDLVDAADRDALRTYLADIGPGVVRRTRWLKLRDASGAPLSVQLSGYRLPDMNDHAFLSISFADTRRVSRGIEPPISTESFTARAAERLSQAAKQEGDFALTVLDLGGFDELVERADAARVDQFLDDVVGRLRSRADGADAVSRFRPDRFGVIHDRQVSLDADVDWIEADTRDLDPVHRGVSVAQASLALRPEGLSEGDAVRALIYTISQISLGGPLDISTLRAGYEAMLDDTLGRLQSFRRLMGATNFGVAFQPIVRLADRKIHHYEALARFAGAASGVSPFDLISFAEDTGLIAEFDLAMAARVLDTVKEAGPRAPAVAINVSMRSIDSPAFIEKLRALTDGCHRPAGWLMFEITESFKIIDLTRADDALQRLRRAGFAVCLDDFGVGASNLDYLRRLQVDYVKIDGSYVMNLATTPHAKAFLAAIVQLCARLGIKTIAECVESDEVARLLRDAGVDFAQGFLFGRPEGGLPGALPPARAGAGAGARAAEPAAP